MKLFIGLLIIAAGAGAFFFFRNRKQATSNSFQKDLIIGKWKLDSINVNAKDRNGQIALLFIAMDSNSYKYRYDIRKDGNILVSLIDSVNTDTSHYEWSNKNELAWTEHWKDSTSEVFTVTKLTMDSLLLQSQDSAIIFLSKLR